MKAEQFYWLLHNSYGEFAKRAMNDHVTGVSNGDEDFDKAFFSDFFDYVGKNPSSLENREFGMLFYILVMLGREVLEAICDFEKRGDRPLGVDAYLVGKLADKLEGEWELFGALHGLQTELEWYEKEYEIWANEEPDDYGIGHSDFVDFKRINTLRYKGE